MSHGLGGQGPTCYSSNPAARVRPMVALSLCFEGLVLELQRACILRHGADHVVRHASWNVRLNLERHVQFRADQPGQMGDNLVGNTASISTDAGWIQSHSPVESPHLWCLSGFRRDGHWAWRWRALGAISRLCGLSFGLLLFQRPLRANE